MSPTSPFSLHSIYAIFLRQHRLQPCRLYNVPEIAPISISNCPQQSGGNYSTNNKVGLCIGLGIQRFSLAETMSFMLMIRRSWESKDPFWPRSARIRIYSSREPCSTKEVLRGKPTTIPSSLRHRADISETSVGMSFVARSCHFLFPKTFS